MARKDLFVQGIQDITEKFKIYMHILMPIDKERYNIPRHLKNFHKKVFDIYKRNKEECLLEFINFYLANNCYDNFRLKIFRCIVFSGAVSNLKEFFCNNFDKVIQLGFERDKFNEGFNELSQVIYNQYCHLQQIEKSELQGNYRYIQDKYRDFRHIEQNKEDFKR
ncbi:hypothetical protein [Wolbachia endosymbiont of Pentidionis agamae]|uniref:hypothetical protein n=1 Tax=Wolbachia endosymbiont of Pentidionis agamae TaxID=3110435 RepID=UPI002FD22727